MPAAASSPGGAGGTVSGNIKRLIDELITLRTQGNEALAHFVRAHLVMKGIQPDRYTDSSPDDPKVIAELERMISDFRG